MKRASIIAAHVLAGASLLAWSCSDKGGEDAKTNEGGDDGDTLPSGTLGLSSELSASYPEGLAISAFPQAVDSEPGVAAAGTIAAGAELSLQEPCPPPPEPMPDGCIPPDPNAQDPAQDGGSGEFDPFATHPKDRLEESHERLAGTADSCFDGDIVYALHHEVNMTDGCFGFDYGMVSGESLGNVDIGKVNTALQGLAPADQSLAGVKAAIQGIDGLVPDTTPEACMVKVGRQMVEQAASRVEGALRVFEGMLCQAKKDSVAEGLPEVGKSLDLKAVFQSYQNATFSEATVKRLDDRDGRAVYRSKLTFSVNGGPAGGEEMSVTLVHSPSADGNTAYDGVMWFERERTDDQNGATYAVLTTIAYSKSGATLADQRLRMEIRNADFNKSKVTAEVLAADGRIDLNAGADASGSFGPGDANDYVEGIRYFAFDVNPSSYAGKISFWNNPGGNYDEAARGFLFESTQNDDGTLAGCAYSGAHLNTSIRKAVAEGLTLEPTGCYTPQLSYGACGNGGNNQGTQIWKQCFKQGSDGYYVIDTAATTAADGFDIVDLATEQPALPAVDASAVGAVGEVRDAE